VRRLTPGTGVAGLPGGKVYCPKNCRKDDAGSPPAAGTFCFRLCEAFAEGAGAGVFTVTFTVACWPGTLSGAAGGEVAGGAGTPAGSAGGWPAAAGAAVGSVVLDGCCMGTPEVLPGSAADWVLGVPSAGAVGLEGAVGVDVGAGEAGVVVRSPDGTGAGSSVGSPDGAAVGAEAGSPDGAVVGVAAGAAAGAAVGALVGSSAGSLEAARCGAEELGAGPDAATGEPDPWAEAASSCCPDPEAAASFDVDSSPFGSGASPEVASLAAGVAAADGAP
jgi:hypothetical protein